MLQQFMQATYDMNMPETIITKDSGREVAREGAVARKASAFLAWRGKRQQDNENYRIR